MSMVESLEEELPLSSRRGNIPLSRAKVCTACKQHRSLYRYNGHVRADRYHTLCFRCYRKALDRWCCLLLVTPHGVEASPSRTEVLSCELTLVQTPECQEVELVYAQN
jgi:hypothetical protein